MKQNIIRCLKTNDDVLIGLYCGIWAGDGTQYYDKGYRVKICLDSRNQELIDFVKKLLLDLFGKTYHVIKEVIYPE